jgi:ElaA protein
MDITYTLKYFTELTLDELYALMQLRQEVFVVEQECPYLDADGKDKKAYHLLGRDENGTLRTYARLLDEGTSYPGFASIGRVINAKEIRGLGTGRELIRKSIETIHQLYPEWPVKIGAQTYLQKFYEDAGFVDIGVHYLEDGIPHMQMILQQEGSL